MTRHAKASSAGSTQRQASGRGRFFRGAFASHGAHGGSKGSGARSGRRAGIAAAFCTSLLALALTASPALGGETHLLQSSFGSFGNVQGLAVDQANGNLYVLDVGNGSVSRFNAAGSPVNFSASAAYVSGNQLTGTSDGGFAISGGNAETQIAVAPPGSPAGTAGNIYVAESAAGAIAVFAPSGQFLGKIDGSGNANPVSGGELCGVATDPSGNLYLGYFSGHIDKYVPSANPPLNSDFNSELTGVGGVCNVTASSSHVFGVRWSSGPITSYPLSLFPGGGGAADASAAGTVVSDGNAPVSTAAVDFSNDDLYLDEESQIAQLDSAGTQIAHFGSAELTGSHGVAIDSSGTASDGNLYALSATGKVEIYGPPVIVPDASSEAATAVLKDTATLHGTVSADGGPEATCLFQYVSDAHFNAEGFENPTTAPCAPAGPFTGFTVEAVSAAISGLDIETGYRFRLLASNANGSSSGATLSFTTLGAVNLTTGAASAITGSSATLNGTINPEGTELEECKFEYGTTASYGQSVPCAESPATIGSGSSPVSVHADLSALDSGTNYHFRLAAKNSFGFKAGGDAAFTTLGPIIHGQSVSEISDTSAKLEAIVNPHGGATGYLFEYVTQAEFEASGYAEATPIPTSGEAIGSDEEDLEVSQQASGLAPATTYHFHVLATNPSGSAEGPDQTFTTFATAPDLGACLDNEAFRSGPGARLPDCRAYEQASPVDKNGTDVGGRLFHTEASISGDAVIFQTNSGIPGGVGEQELPLYVARRGASSWSTRGLLPPPSFGVRALVSGWTTDLSLAFSFASHPGTPNQTSSVVAQNLAASSFQNVWLPYLAGARFNLAGASADDSKIFFEASVTAAGGGVLPVTSGPAPASTKKNLYLWDRDSGTLTLVGVLPAGEGGGAPAAGSFAGPFDWWYNFGESEALERGGASAAYFTQGLHAISTSGDKAFFTAGASGQIYLRQGLSGPSPETVRVSASQRTTPDPNGAKPAIFLRATPDGSRVFFSSCEKLTDDSTAVSTSENNCQNEEQGADLYAYDTASGDLTDLTVDGNASDPQRAGVQAVLGASDDGSYVYFAANGHLDDAAPAAPGNCRNLGQAVYEGSRYLYLWHDGTSTFIAPLGASGGSEVGDAMDWAPHPQNPQNFDNLPAAMASADGLSLVFRSRLKQTAYENSGIPEFYRFHVGDSALVCVTCNPTDAPPRGTPALSSVTNGALSFNTQPLLQRNLSAGGSRFFFDTTDKLVAADTNGDAGCLPLGACQDTYEWEAEGTGSCHISPGCIYLLSTGTSSTPSYFADASASGDDAFIFTRDPLVPQDQDELQDVYDVRVDGGLAFQHPAPPPPPCEGEACRGAATGAPATTGASSAVFQGDGNPPVKRHHKKRHHKKKRSHKRAGHSHGGAK